MTRDPCTQSSRSLVRFSVAEALTNPAKHSRAKHATFALYRLTTQTD